MLIRIISILAILALAAMYAVNSSDSIEKAQAQTIPQYDYEFNAVNIYDAFYLEYEISGLNTSNSYSWTLYSVNPATGTLLKALGRIDQPAGVTSTTWQFGVGDDVPHWPDNFSGPVVVLDNNGATLGRHYVTETPEGDWFNGGGNQVVYDMLLLTNDNLANSSCPSALHNDINADGWMHGFTPCESSIPTNGYALLHYQINFLSYATSTDTMVIYEMGFGEVTQTSGFEIDDIIDYQTTSGYGGAADIFAYRSFVIVNFSEDELPFIDYGRADANFGSSVLTNPQRMGANSATGFPSNPYNAGAYSCASFSGASLVEECESTLLVTRDPDGDEWDINANASVQDSGTQSYEIETHTLEIWSSYSNSMEVSDSEVGLVDDTIYGFLLGSDDFTRVDRRVGTYTVGAAATEDVVLTYTVEPRTLIAGATAALDEMSYAVTFTYDINEVISLEDAFSGLIGSSGFNTDGGKTFIHGAIIAVFLAGAAAIPLARKHPITWALAWTVGGALPAFMEATHSDLSNLLWFLGAIVFWLVAIMLMRSSSDMGVSA